MNEKSAATNFTRAEEAPLQDGLASGMQDPPGSSGPALTLEGAAARGRAHQADRGPGTIEPLPSGRFRLRFFRGGKLVTADTFDTWAEAETMRVRLVGDLAHDMAPEHVKTLADFGDKVIEERELGGIVKDGTNDKSRWKNHVRGDRLGDRRAGIGAMPVRDVATDDVKAWLQRLFQRGLSRQTRIHCLNLLRAVLDGATEARERRGPNPCAGIKLKKERRTHETWTFLEPAEQARLLAVAKQHYAPEDAIIEFAIGSGLRGGELVALRLEDVHIDGDEPHVIVRYGDMASDATKSGKPRRVDLLPTALAALRRWLAALPSFCLATKGKPPNTLGLMFPGRRGGMRNHDHVLRWDCWKGFQERGKAGDKNHRPRRVGLVELAGLPERVRWHDLRHTCASSLINGWWGRMWTLAEVQQMLGHSSAKTTERYAHLAESAQRTAAKETRAAFHALSTRPVDAGGRNENPQGFRGSGTRVSNSRPSAWEAPGNGNDLALLGARGKTRGKETAVALLAAVGGQDDAVFRALSVRLASEVLGLPAVALAHEILAGGARAVDAATELAELIARAEGESEVLRASGDGR